MTLAANFGVFRQVAAIGVAVWLIGSQTVASGQGAGREGGAAPREIMRARPPAAAWDKPTLRTFLDDAFEELEGERPDFAATSPRSGAGAAAQPGGAASPSAGGGFKWSALVSAESLADEIKDMKSALSQAVASQSDFKGGGYDKAREAFSTVALCFAVIAAYDQDVRWKKDAETARDLFARVGFNCKVGTEQSFNESKLRVADLETLLEGGSPTARPDREEDFRWSQVAGRPALMSRLESADGTLAAASASKGDFDKSLERVLRDAEVVALIGEVIQREEFEYHDDDTYKGYAAGMRDAAVRVRDAAQKKDYDAARAALGELKKSCDACHGDYRS
ncbi:MAG: cytochrome c [Planctomycetia bacterium]